VQSDTEALIEKFCIDTLRATGLLYQEGLYGHMLVVLYSSIDSMGLLDAPENQTSASGHTFKNWVKNYLLPNGEFEFDEGDFWAARCSVLHTFTSESDLSRSGRAKKLQYYSGPKDSSSAQAFVEATKYIDGGTHAPAHIEDTYLAFLEALKVFPNDLLEKCKDNEIYETRLRNLLQRHSI